MKLKSQIKCCHVKNDFEVLTILDVVLMSFAAGEQLKKFYQSKYIAIKNDKNILYLIELWFIFRFVVTDIVFVNDNNNIINICYIQKNNEKLLLLILKVICLLEYNTIYSG